MPCIVRVFFTLVSNKQEASLFTWLFTWCGPNQVGGALKSILHNKAEDRS